MNISAKEAAANLRAALADLPPGAKKVKIDGLEAELSITEAIQQIKYFEAEAAKELGNRPKISRIRLDG